MRLLQELDYSTVLANSIHDMKNSLSLLIGTLHDTSQHCQTGTCKSSAQFDQLHYEGKRVNDHLVQLLALYRIGNSQYFINSSEHDVLEFLEEMILAHEDLLNYRKISFEINCEDDACWFFDRDLITGVLTNIINNLYVYTKDAMEIKVENTNDFLAIHIKDNGEGYPEHMLCNTDQQQQKNLDFATASTGLGLYFATKAAEMHKNKNRRGFICISNEGLPHCPDSATSSDKGGCFSIYLP